MEKRPTTSEKETGDIVNFLGKISIFKELSKESLEKISEKIQMYTFAKDTIIIKQNSPGNRLYLVKSGRPRVVSESDDGDFDIATIPDGECFGEMSLLTGETCCATVKTNEDSLLYFITKSDFDEVISENPQISKHFNRLFADRMIKQNILSIDIKKHEIALSKYLQKAKVHQYSGVVWKSKRMQRVFNEADKYSKNDAIVTIIGKPGTGKEILSRKIHMDSAKAKSPVFEIVLPKERRKERAAIQNERRQLDHTESEIFGREKIIYTADQEKRIGCLELVNNGTLIIKNIENMSLNIQERFLRFLETGKFLRIGDTESVHSNVRTIVTTTDINIMQKQLGQRLFQMLSAQKLEIPPLCEHKKDIPSLIEHFTDKISNIRHTSKKTFSKDATNKLLKYDYPGNVKELENVIERAITLSESEKDIEEEVIFLGEPTAIEDEKRANLLNITIVEKLCKSPGFISAIKTVTLIAFITLLCLLAMQSEISIGGKNVTLILCWQLSIPLLFVLFLFTARFGCGICPIYSISKFLNKRNLRMPIPEFIKRHDAWIMGIGFISILFLEEYTHMSASISKTAFLIFTILFAAIIVDFIFEKSAWCRHLCPLGGMISLFSMSSLIEIRANRNVCNTICTTHDCFKGSEKVDPCPMFLHLQFLSDNRYCKVCLNCIKNCTHLATRLNLRIPGAEISSLKQPSLPGAIFSIILSGLLIAEIFTTTNIVPANYLLVFSIPIMFALSLNLAINFFTARILNETVIEHLKHFGYTLIPLILFGFISHYSVDVFGNVKGSLMILSIYKLDLSFTTTFQLLTVLTGLFLTEHLTYKIILNKIAQNLQFRIFAIQGTVPLVLSITYIMLFLYK
ncbi:MAG: sigma 54-interacting transcriptional regulator [Candidatus Scalindua sp.]|jgi:transcriptional regulator with AAA-type ATPase domain|nr:sigma 54-interacting transcriptional regulator [Candidatus Scalindua sp.]MDV5166246.1 sigma 54-interacting transcriptional regulator [Candidatus Scalindua sp.]